VAVESSATAWKPTVRYIAAPTAPAKKGFGAWRIASDFESLRPTRFHPACVEVVELSSSLVSAMTEPGFYPHGPAQVELRQTHISYVFLAGDYVYKIKKPVRFTFLDYSTLEKRRYFCLEELRLNRRLAPRIYLAVVPISRDVNRFVPEDARLPAVEYAVKMVRLPEERMLDRLVSEGRAGNEDIDAIVAKLAA
jgi:uncharacterized protein